MEPVSSLDMIANIVAQVVTNLAAFA